MTELARKDYILSCQTVLMGQRDVVGFGDGMFDVRVIPRNQSNDLITANHYSHTVVNNSYVHLGVFQDGKIMGCLQYGYAMNPASGGGVVSGTGNNEYLELNRMWLDDALPRNSESQAISYSLKIIKRLHRDVAWVQSFADERCGGRLGVVYQACSFLYCGGHEAIFWELDGKWYHNIAMTCTDNSTLVL